jgi:hypothetical protein
MQKYRTLKNQALPEFLENDQSHAKETMKITFEKGIIWHEIKKDDDDK